MSKNQSYHPLLFILFLAIFGTVPYITLGQDFNQKLVQADSLFKLRKYTESYDIYSDILESGQKASNQMLLKMAFIKEGLGDYSEALFYLNKYYRHSSDKRARYKMEELAKTNDLQGYSANDTDLFVGFINKNYIVFNAIVLVVAGFLFFVIIYRKVRKKERTTPYTIALAVLLLAFWFVTNFRLDPHKGIIIENHAYLMEAPSSGSDLKDVIKKGHRVHILDEDELWTKILWDNQEAYIRSDKIKVISGS